MPHCMTVKGAQNYLKKQTKRCMLTVLIQVLKLRIVCRKIAKITFAKKGIKIIL